MKTRFIIIVVTWLSKHPFESTRSCLDLLSHQATTPVLAKLPPIEVEQIIRTTAGKNKE
jgi:hypothetical protein